MYWILTFLFGAGVGASELISRYRDAPFSALHSGWGFSYVVVNALASLGAYALILLFDIKFGVDGASRIAFTQALVAGFGSMVFFRSSLLTMKVGETDVAVGPAIFFQVLLFATDRACDRGRAQPRSLQINEIMRGVSFEQAQEALPNFCFELMQNVSATESQQFRQVVNALSSAKMRDDVKVLNLGLMLRTSWEAKCFRPLWAPWRKRFKVLPNWKSTRSLSCRPVTFPRHFPCSWT